MLSGSRLECRPPLPFSWNSENSKANRIETMKGPAEPGQICSVGRRKIAKKIAKNKRCHANTLRPRSRMLLKVMKGGLVVLSQKNFTSIMLENQIFVEIHWPAEGCDESRKNGG